MKKIALAALFTFFSLESFALPVGNPSEATLLCDGILWDGNNLVTLCDYWRNPFISWFDVLTLRGGYYGDFVFDRHMQAIHKPHKNVGKTKINTNAGYVVLNFFEQFDVFGVLGMSKFHIDSNASVFRSTPGRRLEIESNSQFSWGVGARSTFFQCGCTSFGVEGQYFCTHPHLTRLTLGSDVSVYPDDCHIHLKYHEWQVGIGVTQKIGCLYPYVAYKWSRAKLSFDHRFFTDAFGPDFRLSNLDSANSCGFAFGATLTDCGRMGVTVEGRIGDEQALYVNGQVRF